ncbi:unnamed protein product, partial [Heterosigma akashiwo]
LLAGLLRPLRRGLALHLDGRQVLAVLVAEDVALPAGPARAAHAAGRHVLHDGALAQVLLGDAADARRPELVVLLVDDESAAQSFVPWLFPLCNQCCICKLHPYAVVIHFSRDVFVDVKHVIYVATTLPIDLVNRPKRFAFPLSFMRFINLLAQLFLQCCQNRLDVFKAFGGLHFASKPRHFSSPAPSNEQFPRKKADSPVCASCDCSH